MKKLIAILLPVLIIASCSKKPDNDCDINRNNIAGVYKVTKAVYKFNEHTPNANFYDFLYPEPCNKDDVFSFQADGSYTMLDGGTTCAPVNNHSGTWSVLGNVFFTDGVPAIIEYFECNKTLVISMSDFFSDGDKLTLTYTRQ